MEKCIGRSAEKKERHWECLPNMQMLTRRKKSVDNAIGIGKQMLVGMQWMKI